MFKLFGFLIGSALSIAVILMITGIPKFHLEDPAIHQNRFDEAVEKLMARKLGSEQAAKTLADNLVQAAVSVQQDFTSPDNDAATESQPMEPVAEPVPEDTDENIALPETALPETSYSFEPPGAEARSLADMQWYSFWNPFRSEIAASGFVSRLEKVTGLDYRIVKVKTGVYEVAFAYDNDDERRVKLSQISAATGLDLPDS